LEPASVRSTKSEERAISGTGRFSHTDSLWNIVGIAESDSPGMDIRARVRLTSLASCAG